MQMDCGLLIKNIDHSLARKANDSLSDDDITFSQLRFMAYINETPKKMASMKEMEQFYNVTQPTVAGIIKRLERKGLVVMCQDPNDRRAKCVYLTDTGYEILERQEKFRQGIQKILLSPLTPQEQDVFMDLLRRVWENIRDEESAPDIVIMGTGLD